MFPYEVLSQYSNNSGAGSSSGNYGNPSTGRSAETKTNSVCKSIASAVIRSGSTGEEFVDFSKIKIPKEILILGTIFLTKSALYLAYHKAQKSGVDITDL